MHVRQLQSAFNGDYGDPPCTKDTLRKFCKNEWPTFGVGWPEEGSLNPIVISKVHQIVTGEGHWDQYPYIDQWQAVQKKNPSWLRKCQAECGRICLTKEKNTHNKKKVLSQEVEEIRRPPTFMYRDKPRIFHQRCLSYHLMWAYIKCNQI